MSITAAPPIPGHIHQLRFARVATNKLLDGITQDQLCAQPGPCVNHALWMIGHLATTDDYMMKAFGGSDSLTLPEKWHQVFGMGSKPSSDASHYPPLEEVRRAFDERRNALLKWYESMSAEQLRQPMSENWRKYAPTLGDSAHFLAWHEGYHGGQLAVLRRALGLGPAFG